MTPTQPGIDPATLAPGTPVEMEHVTTGSGVPMLSYAYPDGWRASPPDFYALNPWDEWRIVRVLGDVTPWPTIAPEDARVGMRVRANYDSDESMQGRVDDEGVLGLSCGPSWASLRTLVDDGCTLRVHPDDAPTADPDADLIEAMARAAYAAGNECWAWESTTDGAREAYLIEARAALAVVRAHDAKAGA